ncbi:MAG: transposase [Xenococcaceae cyanobacterium MO_188.B19]|nr:transposase [Xenococcaceae cyanobacterium MO_188.B19]
MYSIKVQLKLNNREKTKMNQHLRFARFCYNYGLSLYNQLDHEEYPGGSSKKIDLIKKVFTNVTKKNPNFAWTKKLSSRVYQNAFRNLKTAFSRFFKGLAKYPKYKKKKHPGSFTVDSSNGVILQEGGKLIKLPTLGTFRTFESIPKCVSQTYTVSKKGDKYYVAFTINAQLIPRITHEVFEPVGIDVNLSDGKYCVISDGTEITYPKPLLSAINKLRKLQYHNRNKQLGNRKKGILASNKARKYYRKLAKLQKQIADKRNDFLQKLTTDLARKYRHIRLETLNIKGLMQNYKLAFHFADASFYKFKTLLQNKALSHGGIVESVDMFYPSSKLCSRCGNKKDDLKLKDRIYHCSNA